MRILCYNWRDLANPAAGGAEVFTEEILRRWVEWGHEVTLFASHVGNLPRHEVVEGVDIVRSGSRMSVYREARRFWKKHAKRFDVVVDEINTRPFATPSFVRETPIVALMHQLAGDVWRYETPAALALLGERVLEPRWLTPYRDVPTMTISRSSAQSLAERGFRDVTVVPVGMSTPSRLSEDFDPPGVPTAAFLGRLAPNKRPTDAIEAFRLAAREVPDAQLWVIGSGPLFDRLRLNAPSGVSLLGRLEEKHKAERLAAADVLLATSVREGWGLNVSEAAWFGTPTIGYRVPGLVDSIPASGGHLVEPSPEAMATALVAFWTGQLTLTARSSTLPWDEVARHCLKVTEHVMGGGRASDILFAAAEPACADQTADHDSGSRYATNKDWPEKD